jgi:hypothetical protein
MTRASTRVLLALFVPALAAASCRSPRAPVGDPNLDAPEPPATIAEQLTLPPDIPAAASPDVPATLDEAQPDTSGPPDGTVAIDALRFEDDLTRARFFALHEWSVIAAPPPWRHQAAEVIGNFVRERWCAPAVPLPACEGGAAAQGETAGTAWYELSTLHYEREWPSVWGLVWSAGRLPEDAEWGMSVHLSLGGRGVIGDGLHVTAQRLADGRVVEKVELGAVQEVAVEETRFTAMPPGPGDGSAEAYVRVLEAELRRLLASPESLRETVVSRLEALRAEVERGMAAHEARRCEYGEPPGDGVPPACTPAPLGPEEEAAALERARAEIDRRRGHVEARAAVFHRLLAELAPPQAIFP